MSIILKGFETVHEALREELDVHSVFTWTKFLHQGLDSHFEGRAYYPGAEGAIDINNYWKQLSPVVSSDGEFKSPATVNSIACYSKNTFNLASFRTKLPTFTKDGQCIWLGFENDSARGTGIASFSFLRIGGIEYLYINCGGLFNFERLGITSALPSDAKTVRHVYSVIVLEPWVEFYIDNTLVALGLNSPNLALSNTTYPPYGILCLSLPVSTRQVSLIEVAGLQEELILPLAPSNVRLSNTAERPPRVFRLYEAGTTTLFAEKSIASGTLTSHPFPLFGYASKTIHFRANTASATNALVIETLTQAGNWRAYDTVTYSANSNWFYSPTGSLVLARLSYTPASYPATVNEGEVILS